MDYTGFANSFSEGEIAEDAWDRVDIQPVTKGVEQAINTLIMVSGPLRKRRGFFRVGAVADQTKLARLVPFRRSIADAQMLELGDSIARVWQINGAPLLFGGVQVQFATPYPSAQLAGLRWKQIGDVIYFRDAAGHLPTALTRINGGVIAADWTFANIVSLNLTNGPWLAENADATSVIALANTAGPADILDTGPTNAGSIPSGASVTVTASKPIFNANQIGTTLRIRANGDSVSALGWSPGQKYAAGRFVVSAGNMYEVTVPGASGLGSNPPVQLLNTQSDGDNVFLYLHDGAGVVEITGFTSTVQVTGIVSRAVPVKSAVATSSFAFNAYSADQGWPTAWPEIREERLVEGATASNPDFVDMTSTAGFSPTTEDFTPGTGLGQITDVNAIRRRVGVDGSKILWFCVANYLLCGTEESEHLIAGSVLDEPLSPSALTIKDLSTFGSDPVAPVRVWNGLCFVQRGGQTVRWISIDTQQGATFDDFSVLASHIGQRQFAQLAWQPSPDQALIARIADGGMASMTYHKEQNVRGWTRWRLPGGVIEPGQAPALNGWICEDVAMLPGLGRIETAWLIVSRTKGGATQRIIWQQAQPADALFMDGALKYSGAPATVFGGLTDYVGETVRVLADGGQIDNLIVDGGGHVTLPAAASNVYVGLAYQVQIKSLKFAVGMSSGTLNTRQSVPSAIVSFRGAQVTFGLDGAGPTETILTRQKPDVPVTATKRKIAEVTLAGGDDRDPRIIVTEDSAYDFLLYSIKPKVSPGG